MSDKKRRLKQYKYFLTGDIVLQSQTIIGSGDEVKTDSDILRDAVGNPFIPATSFVGVLKNQLEKYSELNGKLDNVFGFSKGDDGLQSRVNCSDLVLTNSADIFIRDGIRIDNETGLVEDAAKFDFETIDKGASFKMKLELNSDDKEVSDKLMKTIQEALLNQEISIGGKTNLGYGKIKLINSELYYYDFNKKEDVNAWLSYTKPVEKSINPETYEKSNTDAQLLFTFSIKDNLIIRQYNADPDSSDASQIKSSEGFIIPGNSIKGAVRARAERICKTVNESFINNKSFDLLFGKKLDNDAVSKKDEKTIPSRIRVNEIYLREPQVEKQTRNRIDRFTGSTMNGALFDSEPVFTLPDHSLEYNLEINIKNATKAEVGLLLLVIKDLWTSDLAIGGEKNVGRGTLVGKSLKIVCQDKKIFIDDKQVTDEDKTFINDFISQFNNTEIPENIQKLKKLYLSKEEV
ncbi:MAG: hypothetical protein JXQ65_10555 [Candidatus Marinimicrobia bacterium]|nr:hypothetical protein [Candidatus Neomarinimicrobiota bacterium]